ncbi:uncharacterized protein BYT42DRAFT_547483 [Radiomyces spectabilis]|uniref:uncharacterized protein n=1 Tax=Radiomyces spectabilis TaxID=64574 RepID=UPI00221EFBF8|nr:uncharacterized protein BYT42DRAFT_547483 [Radiomyces spectabilis]KAI8374447.1 hypothetical protein BYT42DRAFT_547483 [Radiomyces spectabilis]
MYYYDNPSSSYHNDRTNLNTDNENDNNNSDHAQPLFSQPFEPSHHLQTAVDNDLSYLSLGNMGSHSYDPSYLNEMLFPGSGVDSHMYLNKEWDDMYIGQDFMTHEALPDSQQQQGYGDNPALFMPLTSNEGEQHPPSQTSQEKSNLFLSLAEQEQQAILLSDPNFLRQHQLLQDKQKAMQKLEAEEQGSITTSTRSNLSAMFDPPPETEVREEPPGDAALRETQFTDRTSSQAQQSETPTSKPANRLGGKSQARKDLTKRSQTNRKSTNPIPISGTPSSSGKPSSSSSVPTEVDHQRRFNELQARFRINYARKSSPNQKNAASSSTSSSSFSGTPSSLGRIQTQPQHTTASSASRYTFSTNEYHSSTPTSTVADPQQQRQQQQQQQPLGSDQGRPLSSISIQDPPVSYDGIPNQGVAIPGNNRDNASSLSSSFGAQPSSFPSRTMPIQIQRMQRANASQPFDAEQHQRRLDDQLVKVDFDDITVTELKEMLRQRGKPATGKKAILLQRLQEERELIKAMRDGRQNRHSQPPPASARSQETSRPRSFQGSSPMTVNVGSPQSPMIGSPSSVSNFIPGSPSAALNRSMANIHIGSPPMSASHPRRYSPYATPSSPRLGSSSPKLQAQQSVYSSSLPTNDIASSPNYQHPSLSSSFSSRIRPSYYHHGWGTNYGPNGRPKTYAPFTSSALATPDRDDDHDPFDDIEYHNGQTDIIESEPSYKAEDSSISGSVKMEGLEWMDSSIQSLLQQQGLAMPANDENADNLLFPEGLTQEQFMALIGNQCVPSDHNDTAGLFKAEDLHRYSDIDYNTLFGNENNHLSQAYSSSYRQENGGGGDTTDGIHSGHNW